MFLVLVLFFYVFGVRFIDGEARVSSDLACGVLYWSFRGKGRRLFRFRRVAAFVENFAFQI